MVNIALRWIDVIFCCVQETAASIFHHAGYQCKIEAPNESLKRRNSSVCVSSKCVCLKTNFFVF